MSDVKTVPEGWEAANIGEVSDLIAGVAFESDNFVDKIDGIKLLRGDNIIQGSLRWEEAKRWVGEVSERFHLKENDIVLAMDRPWVSAGLKWSKISTNDLPCYLVQRVARLRSKKELDQTYLGHIISSDHFSNYLKDSATGGHVPHISNGQIANYDILLPPLSEQHKIASILSAWDDALATLARLIDTKRQQKRALAEQLLTGKRRLKGFEGEWEKKTVADVASEFSKKGQNKSLTVLSCTKHNGLVRSLEYFGKQIFSQDISGYKLVKRNMLAYATNHIDEGSIGLQNIEDEAVISPMYTVIEAGNSITSEFLFALLKTETYLQLFIARMSASVDRRGSLRWKDFSKIPLRLPPLPEQKAIASVLSTLDAELSALIRQQAAVQQQKRGLMGLLLTGRVRVKVDDLQTGP